MGWERADPDRLGRLPGVLAARHRQDRRGRRHVPVRLRRRARAVHARSSRWRSSGRSAATSRCASTSARRAGRTAKAVAAAVDRTLRWAERCHATEPAPGQLRFGIVQGGVDLGLRRDCADALTAIPFDGYAIGGLSVGEERPVMFDVTEQTAPHLPADRPRYFMGIGDPEAILRVIAAGIDMFDCVLPTRLGRTGSAFTWEGRLNLQKRPLHARSGAARRGLHLLHLRPLLTRLPTPSRNTKRGTRVTSTDGSQPILPAKFDAGCAGCHPDRHLCRVP